jgi:hypothetical protein
VGSVQVRVRATERKGEIKMKVSELMEALRLLPPDADVWFCQRNPSETIHKGDIDGIYCEVDGAVDIELVDVSQKEWG